MPERSRAYCGTWNVEEWDVLKEDALKQGTVYCIFGREIAPTTGQKHYQFYYRYKNPQAWESQRAKLPGAHIEVARGTWEQNIEYCSKGGDFVEVGDRPKKGSGGEATKRKWDEIWEAAKTGDHESIPKDILLRHYKNILCVRANNPVPLADEEEQIGYWFHGDTGTGKSRSARARFPDPYLKIANTKWWDGYLGQENVLLEDLDKTHAYMGYHLKIWADRYAFPAEIKGGSMVIRPKRIIVTSNYSPEEIWEDKNTLEPILRRFKVEKFEHDAPESFYDIFN